MFVDQFDLPEDRIERVLQRPVDRVSLRRSELVEVALDAFAGLTVTLAVAALQIAGDVLPSEDGLGDVVGKHQRSIYQVASSARQIASVKSFVRARPPR